MSINDRACTGLGNPLKVLPAKADTPWAFSSQKVRHPAPGIAAKYGGRGIPRCWLVGSAAPEEKIQMMALRFADALLRGYGYGVQPVGGFAALLVFEELFTPDTCDYVLDDKGFYHHKPPAYWLEQLGDTESRVEVVFDGPGDVWVYHIKAESGNYLMWRELGFRYRSFPESAMKLMRESPDAHQAVMEDHQERHPVTPGDQALAELQGSQPRVYTDYYISYPILTGDTTIDQALLAGRAAAQGGEIFRNPADIYISDYSLSRRMLPTWRVLQDSEELPERTVWWIDPHRRMLLSKRGQRNGLTREPGEGKDLTPVPERRMCEIILRRFNTEKAFKRRVVSDTGSPVEVFEPVRPRETARIHSDAWFSEAFGFGGIKPPPSLAEAVRYVGRQRYLQMLHIVPFINSLALVLGMGDGSGEFSGDERAFTGKEIGEAARRLAEEHTEALPWIDDGTLEWVDIRGLLDKCLPVFTPEES